MSTSGGTGAARGIGPIDPADGHEIVEFERIRRRNVARAGTVTHYRVVTGDGIEREVIYGQARTPCAAAQRFPITIGTAPPLSFGVEGMVMHFLLRSLQFGLDGLVIGPERTPTELTGDLDLARTLAGGISLRGTAVAGHHIADRVALEHGTSLEHMCWAGISLGSLKGLWFAALAPEHGRRLLYSHFVAPVCPDPVAPPTNAEYRQFLRGEVGALARASAELMWKDVRDRTFRIHEDVTRLVRPGLLRHYARSVQRGGHARIFNEAWRAEVSSGAGGQGARLLPVDALATFELFDLDEGSPVDGWRAKIGDQLAAGTTRLMVNRGRHGDSTRLTFQRRRARALRDVLDQLAAGTPVAELTHPLAGEDELG